MAFILTEEQQMMVDLARDFARKDTLACKFWKNSKETT